MHDCPECHEGCRCDSSDDELAAPQTCYHQCADDADADFEACPACGYEWERCICNDEYDHYAENG